MAKTIKQLADLQPDSFNANKGTQRGRGMVEASLRETGAGRSILADREGRIIAGNKTLEAWADIGGEIEVVRTKGDKLVVVQREDLDLADDSGTARKLAYYDNRASEVGLEWDAEQLLVDLNAGLDLSGMFREDELDMLIETDVKTNIGDATDSNERKLGNKQMQIKAVLYAAELRNFERAILATGQKNRGAAILEICRHYLETNAKGQQHAEFESLLAQ